MKTINYSLQLDPDIKNKAEETFVEYKPKPETLAVIERIENGEEELVGPFNTYEEYIASLESDDEQR